MNKEMIEKAKLQAQNEVMGEKFDSVKDKLKHLYTRKALAEKAVANIEREILDFELEIQEA